MGHFHDMREWLQFAYETILVSTDALAWNIDRPDDLPPLSSSQEPRLTALG
jgi:hypothetical protein